MTAGGHHDHLHHDHDHGPRWLGPLAHLWPGGHTHDAASRVDSAMEADRRGVRALWVSLVGLGLTAAIQAVVAAISGSVALLGDTLHNVADALTAVPLGIAFWLGRRPATSRYTYGYGRAEDLAGVSIVVIMAASTAAAAWESASRLVHPRHLSHVGAVMAAAVVGFLGNEAVSWYRIRVGRSIGSDALVADGRHARSDGLTSLGVLAGAIGVALGHPLADPVVGLVVTAAILVVLRSAAVDIYRRLMDAVDPDLVAGAREVLAGVPGVVEVGDLRIRWLGHRLLAEGALEVDAGLSVAEGHAIAEDAHHALLHHLPRLAGATLHADPVPGPGGDYHAVTAHHRRPSERPPGGGPRPGVAEGPPVG
ncbi:MAG TPA: cation diffusion facilitator family transporter [Acidimicrobiales bacterium]|nr:cation diffusion facilitator family transporter [Acidimicrobiales bacterium]